MTTLDSDWDQLIRLNKSTQGRPLLETEHTNGVKIIQRIQSSRDPRKNSFMDSPLV